jgi:hypothetical protein
MCTRTGLSLSNGTSPTRCYSFALLTYARRTADPSDNDFTIEFHHWSLNNDHGLANKYAVVCFPAYTQLTHDSPSVNTAQGMTIQNVDQVPAQDGCTLLPANTG